ncbi:homogentisate geranylgeranyltransferase [Citrus sinensis]|nr:homogentisate geranylgeranyltransferase [Citrus sinensis]
MVPGLLMTVYEVAINQLYDVAIDKVNKPNLPLTSGDLSMRTGIAIASSSLLMSLAIGIMLRSPPFLLALIIWFLLASAYSVDVAEKFISNYTVHCAREGTSTPICLLHTHSVAITCCFCFVISVLKDIPDEDGDREFGIRTLSVILGKESVLWLCVYVLFIAYGAAVIVGLTSSPYLLSKLVTIISHSMLATLLWHQARTVDLSSKVSTLSFYMFIWKLDTSLADSHECNQLERSGTGKRPTFQEAQGMPHMHKPKLVFFCETKLTSRQMQEKCQKLNFENCFEKLLEMYRDPWTPRYVPKAPHMDTLKKAHKKQVHLSGMESRNWIYRRKLKYSCGGQHKIYFQQQKTCGKGKLCNNRGVKGVANKNCRENQSWKPPPMGWFKVNVDAATKLEEQVPGLGVVIRNSEGNFIAAAQKQVRYFGDVTAAETKAIKLGIKTAKAANCVPLIIECHCQEAVDLALGRKSSNKEICWTILDIQEKLKNYTTPHYNILLGFIIA